MSDRRTRLPDGVEAYRTIGPFGSATLPEGLRRTHDLKQGTWGRVCLQSGSIVFVWEDKQGGREELAAPAEVIVPPQVPHHLSVAGEFKLTITFFREGGGI